MVPLNYILCFLFTVGMAIAVAFFTIPYQGKTVFLAALATGLITVALTVYACCAKDIEIVYGLLAVFIIAWLPICILGFVWINDAMAVGIILLVIVLFSLYLILDTRMILSAGKSYGGHEIGMDYDDYILGAMILYLDIIMIFMYLLALFGGSE